MVNTTTIIFSCKCISWRECVSWHTTQCNTVHINKSFDVESIALYSYESICCIVMSRSIYKQRVKYNFNTPICDLLPTCCNNYLSANKEERDSFTWLAQTQQVGFLLWKYLMIQFCCIYICTLSLVFCTTCIFAAAIIMWVISRSFKQSSTEFHTCKM